MFGFGFIVSLISFSLSSAHFPRLPTLNGPLSRKPVLGGGLWQVETKGIFCNGAPWVGLCPAPGEQRACILETRTGCRQSGPSVMAWRPLTRRCALPSVLYSLASTAWAAAPSVSLGRLDPRYPRQSALTEFLLCIAHQVYFLSPRKLHRSPE